MAKKRVLLTSIFPLATSFFHGRFIPLARRLSENYDFTFLIRGPLPPRQQWAELYNIVSLPDNVKIIGFLGWRDLLVKTIKLARKHDILFPQKPYSVTGSFCYFLSLILKKGFVLDTDDLESAGLRWSLPQEKLSEFFLRKIAKNVSVASTRLLKQYWPQGDFIPNCPDLKIFDPNKYDKLAIKKTVYGKLGINQDVSLFTWAATFSRQTDTKYMPSVLSKVYNKGLNFRLVLLGGGELREDIITNLKKFGLPKKNVSIMGRVSFTEYVQIMLSSQAAIVPLRNHPFDVCKSPGKLLEPMALEIPVIATDVGEPKFIISQCGCGILICYNDADIAAKQIMDFMSKSNDIRNNMGLAGRRYLQDNHNPEVVAKRLGYLFEKSLNNGV